MGKARRLRANHGHRFPITVRPTKVDIAVAREIARDTAPSPEEVAAFVTAGVAAKAVARTPVELTIEDQPPRAATLLRAMRPHQWVKNLIIFVPLITSHKFNEPRLLGCAVLALVPGGGR